jgi:hypothetical protein
MMAIEVIALAGFVCGVLDLSVTSTLFVLKGGALERLFQGIASGALGNAAFTRGKRTAALGVLFHFVIALSWAGVYYVLGRQVAALLQYAVLSGLLFGAGVHLIMSLLVVPLSRVPKRTFSASAFLTQLAIHTFFVGLPIALVVRRFSGLP